ncbi:MAG: enoyl-CoA hydratase-related protein [Bacteroidia bacterium]
MYETLLYEEKGPIALVTLNRPEVYNAINHTLSQELLDIFKNKLPKATSVRAVILTGTGKAFCSGQDLKEIQGQKRSLGESVTKRYNPLVKSLLHSPKPIICALNGVAAGAGAGLALACDYLIAAEEASFVFAFINIGLVLDTGSSFFLPRLVGYRRALELATLGERIPAQKALAWGMINEVTSADNLLPRSWEIAEKYAHIAPKAFALTKKMLLQSYESSEAVLEREKMYQEIAGRTQDYQEGVEAFLQKRKPQFRGM